MVDIATSNYSSRNGAKVIWVAIHTTEGIMDARDLGFYWQRINNASSHAGCDNNKTVTYVDPAYASWTLLNGNSRSVNMEICGWAKWPRDEWLGPQRGRLIQAANWARQMCDRFGIPKRYIGASGVARGEAGIIGHVDYTNGAHDGNHWDPGPGFPWDVFIDLVNNGHGAPGGGGGNGEEVDEMAGWLDEDSGMAKPGGGTYDMRDLEVGNNRALWALVDRLDTVIEKLSVLVPDEDPSPEIPERKIHVVVKGDTLYSIANKYGTTVEELRRLNNLRETDILSVGYTLLVN